MCRRLRALHAWRVLGPNALALLSRWRLSLPLFSIRTSAGGEQRRHPTGRERMTHLHTGLDGEDRRRTDEDCAERRWLAVRAAQRGSRRQCGLEALDLRADCWSLLCHRRCARLVSHLSWVGLVLIAQARTHVSRISGCYLHVWRRRKSDRKTSASGLGRYVLGYRRSCVTP
jgi:hypothetical protein